MQRQREFHRVRYYSPNPQRRAYRPAAKQRSHGKLMAAACLAVVSVIAGFALHNAGASSSPETKGATTQKPAPEPTKPTITEADMAARINQIVAANPNVDISVSIGDPRDGNITHYGIEAVYEAASVAKVLTGVFYLHNVEKGQQSLDRTIGSSNARHYLQIMIEQSDNTAWKTFNDILDRDRLLEYAKSIGFTDYNPKVNTFTSNDIARLLVQLQQGKLLNYENTQLILGHMKNASRSEYLAPALPPNTTLYHKAGWLEDRIHDAAIIDDGHRPYILVIFTKGKPGAQTTSREVILQQITKLTVARFISNEYLQ